MSSSDNRSGKIERIQERSGKNERIKVKVSRDYLHQGYIYYFNFIGFAYDAVKQNEELLYRTPLTYIDNVHCY